MVGHIWNVCKVSGIRAMPSHVNNQKLQPRFQRVSGHTAHTCVVIQPIDRGPRPIAYLYECRTCACATRERIPDRRSFIAPHCARADITAPCTVA